MKNYIQDGDTLTVIATETMVSGKAYKVGDLSGVAAINAAIGEECQLVTEGVFDLTKTAADVIAQGEKLHLNTTNGELTTVDAGHFLFGIATEAKGNGDLTVPVRIIQSASAAGAAS